MTNSRAQHPTPEQQATEDARSLIADEVYQCEVTARRLGALYAKDAAWTAAYEGAFVAHCSATMSRWLDEAQDYRDWIRS